MPSLLTLTALLTLQVYFTVLFAPVGMLIFGQWNPASLPANLQAAIAPKRILWMSHKRKRLLLIV